MKFSKSCKILICCLLSILLLITPTSFAEEYEEIIEYEYENFRYTIINENEIEILGFVDSSIHTGVLEIPSEIDGKKVTTIGEYAFQGCNLSGGVVFPNTITKIKVGAFNACQIKGRILIPESVTEIESVAFWGNYMLTRIEINNTSGIAEDAFDSTVAIVGEKNSYAETYALETERIFIDISNVIYENGIGYKLDQENNIYKIVDYQDTENEVLEIPEKYNDISVTKIVDYAFSGSNLEQITVPESITELGVAVFSYMPNLRKITIKSEEMKVIPKETFNYSMNLGTINLPDSIEEIGDAAFQNVTGKGIEYFELPPNLKIIGERAFNNFYRTGYGKIPKLIIPESIETIKDRAFEAINATTIVFPNKPINLSEYMFHQSHIKNIEIPYGTTYIPKNAFSATRNLTEITIPDTITSIGDNAFEYSTSLSKITIPASVTTIGNDVFLNCTSFTTIRGYKGSYAETYAINNNYKFEEIEVDTIFTYEVINGNEIRITGLKDSTSAVENLIIPEKLNGMKVTAIGYMAFSQNKNIKGALTLPNTLKMIDVGAFNYCTGLTGELKLPENLEIIESTAFSSCTGLTGKLEFPDTLEKIGSSAFNECTGLTGELIIPEKITKIEDWTFQNCKGLEGVKLSSNITEIGKQAFSRCENIKGSVILPDTLEKLQYGCFEYCYNIEGIEVPKNLTEIPDYAFNGCKSIEKLNLPDALKKIGISAFCDCSNIVGKMELPDNLEIIGYGAFANCIGLEDELELPSSLKSLGSNAFAGCKWLSGELIIPESLSEIPDGAFSQCSNIEKIILPNGLKKIGGSAFYFCTGLSGKLKIPSTVTEIGEWAFTMCTGLTGELKLPENLTKIGGSAFSNCYNLTGTLKIPNKVTSIESGAFAICSGFSSIEFPNSIITIGEYAFQGCDGLKGNLNLPNNLKQIDNMAFSGCYNITGELILPESLTKIGDRVFENCGFIKVIDAQTKVGDLKIEELFPTLTNYKIQKVFGFYVGELSAEDTLSSKDIIYISDSAGNTFATLTVIIKGDVNSDGKIKIYDAFQILKDVLVPGNNLSEIDRQIRDFNGDGQVRIYDAFQFLKQAILG